MDLVAILVPERNPHFPHARVWILIKDRGATWNIPAQPDMFIDKTLTHFSGFARHDAKQGMRMAGTIIFIPMCKVAAIQFFQEVTQYPTFPFEDIAPNWMSKSSSWEKSQGDES